MTRLFWNGETASERQNFLRNDKHINDKHIKGSMAARAQIRGWDGPSRRRVPRFLVQAPLDVTVLRSGIPDTVPGRSVNVCERGIAAILAGELIPGEAVGVEVHLPLVADSL